MSQRLRHCGWIALLLLAATTLRAGERGGFEDLAQILSEDVWMYLHFPNPKVEQAGFEKSVWKEVGQNRDMAAFLEDMEGQRESFIREAAAQNEVDAELVRMMVDGQISLALMDVQVTRAKSLDYGMAIAIRLPKPVEEDTFFEAIAAAVKKVRAKRGLSEAEKALPFRINSAHNVERWPTGHRVMTILEPPPLRFVLMGQTLVIYRGTRTEGLKQLLHNHANPLTAKTLMKSDDYRKVVRGTQAHAGCLFIYLNGRKTYNLVNAMSLPQWTGLLHAFGMDGIDAMGVSMGYYYKPKVGYTGGVRHTLYLQTPASRREGILRAMSLQSGAEKMAGFVPQDTKSFMAARVRFDHLYQQIPPLVHAVEDALKTEFPVYLKEFDGDEKLLGVPVQELLNAFGESFVIQAGPAGTVFRFERAHVDRFARSIATMEATLKSEQRPGFTAQQLTTGAGERATVRYFNRSGYPVPLAPSYCITRRNADGTGTLYVSTHPQAIRAVLRQPADPRITAAADFEKVMLGMDHGYGVFFYGDTRESFRKVYDTLLPATNFLTSVPIFSADPGKLPPGRDVEKYLFGVGLGVHSDDEGITFVSYGPLGVYGFLVHAIDKLNLLTPTSLGMVAGLLQQSGVIQQPGEAKEADTPEPKPAPTSKRPAAYRNGATPYRLRRR